MLIYILKSTACLAILLLFYKLFLEKENMHVFKRFYLLGSLLFALIVPTIVFSEYVVVEPQVYEAPTQSVIVESTPNIPPALESDVIDIAPLLWIFYFFGMFFFGIKFLRNLFQIFLRIRRNPKYKNSSFIQVLLQEKIPPHTFFKYIFLNKAKFESKEIPKEVMLHEETHARQKHSLDVVFIELLQVIFWVNPLIYFFKKAIKLNHEFLADSAVLNKDVDAVTYQNTLLSFLSSESAKKYQPIVSNAINYSSIKKRFTIMKSKTSKKSILLRSLLLLPLLAILILGFSESRLIEIPDSSSEENLSNEEISQPIQEMSQKDRHYEKATFKFRDQNKKVISTKKYNELTEAEKSILVDPIPTPTVKVPSTKQLIDWKDENKYGIWIDDQRVDNEELFNYNKEDFKMFFESKLAKNAVNYGKHFFQVNLYTKSGFEKVSKDLQKPLSEDVTIYLTEDKRRGATKEQISNYNSLAKKYNAVPKKDRVIPMDDLKTLEQVFRKMTDSQKKEALPFPECPQDGATKKQVAEYNALAEKYNRMINAEENIWIKKGDVERLEYLHGLMSEEQRENAEPFPDFPEPPPPPEMPDAPGQIEEEMLQMEHEMARREAEMKKQEMEMELQEKSMKRQEREMEKQEVEMERQERILEEQEIQADFPAAPNLAYRVVDQKPLSKKLKGLVDKFAENRKSYQNAVKDYLNNGKGNYDKIRGMHRNLMESYDEYKILANEEGVLAYPVPAFAPRVKKGEKSDIPPPPPPSPESPLEHVKEMAEKDADFYFDGKKISSKKAIEMVEKNKDINIQIRETNVERPLVKLSTEPIQLKKI